MNTRTEFLENTLLHIIRTAQNSRTQTKRLLWIEKRCKDALDGIPYNRDEFVLPVMNTKTPVEYDRIISELKSQINAVKNMTFLQRVKFVFMGEK